MVLHALGLRLSVQVLRLDVCTIFMRSASSRIKAFFSTPPPHAREPPVVSPLNHPNARTAQSSVESHAVSSFPIFTICQEKICDSFFPITTHTQGGPLQAAPRLLLVVSILMEKKRIAMANKNGDNLQWRKRSMTNTRAPGESLSAPVLKSRKELGCSSPAPSSAALDAYLKKYHVQIEPSGQRVIGGRLSRGPLGVLSRGTAAQQLQPESPLSRFKKQAACVAWKISADPLVPSADSDNDLENSDSSNAVAEPPPHISTASEQINTDMKERRPQVLMSLLTTSATAQALLDKVREAKELGGGRRELMILPQHSDGELDPDPGKWRETQQSVMEPSGPPSQSVEAIVKVVNAAVAVQRVWRNRHERAFCVPQAIEDHCSSPGEIAIGSTIEIVGQSESHEVIAIALPRPPQSTSTRVASMKTRIGDAFAGPAREIVDDQSKCCTSEEETPGVDAKVASEPFEALWMDDDWVCLEEGGYPGDLEAMLGSQAALSSIKISDEDLLVWRHPQKLIERHESERVAWLEQCKRHRGIIPVRMAHNDLGQCDEEVHIETTLSIETQAAECDVATEPLAPVGAAAKRMKLSSSPPRRVVQVPLPKWRLRRNRCARKKIRVQVRLRRRESESTEWGSQKNTSQEDTKCLSACQHHQPSLSSMGMAEQEKKPTVVLEGPGHRFVIFSSSSGGTIGRSKAENQRNDLISIEDEGSVSAASDWESGRLDRSETCGFIHLNFVARDEKSMSTVLSTPSRQGTASHCQFDRGVEGKGIADALQPVIFRSASSVNRSPSDAGGDCGDGGETSLPQRGPERMTFDSWLSDIDDQELHNHEHAGFTRDDEPKSENCAPQFATKFTESSELVSLCGLLPVQVDAAKKEEFCRILDEFKASLRLSSSSPLALCSSESFVRSHCSKSELASGSALLENQPTQTTASNRKAAEEEDDEVIIDDELQAMLHEISHFQQHFQHAAGNGGTPR